MKISASAALTLLLSLSLALCLPHTVQAAAIPINDLQDLQNIKDNLGADYYLAGDIDAGATAGWNGAAGFEPIGSSVKPFTGRLDGRGHEITGLTINRPFLRTVGLFGFTNGATIENLGMEAVDINGLGDVGGLVGSGNSGRITNCYTTGVVSANNTNAGGMLGVLNNGQVDNAYSQVRVSRAASNGGGLVGRNIDGSVINCYSTGPVAGTGILGGLVGNSNLGATATSSYWDRQTSGQNASAGGEAKSTAEMMQKATYGGWDFDNVWNIRQNAAYPGLRVFAAGLGTPPPGYCGTASVPGFTPYGILALSLFIIGSKIWLVRRKNKETDSHGRRTLPPTGKSTRHASEWVSRHRIGRGDQAAEENIQAR